jgi:hypothetical protein
MTQITAKDIDIETVDLGIRHGGRFLCGRGHRVKSFKSVCERQRSDLATVRAAVHTAVRSAFTHWRPAAQCHLGHLRLIGLLLSRIPIGHIRMALRADFALVLLGGAASSGLLQQ